MLTTPTTSETCAEPIPGAFDSAFRSLSPEEQRFIRKSVFDPDGCNRSSRVESISDSGRLTVTQEGTPRSGYYWHGPPP
jgi:hypothetical protein